MVLLTVALIAGMLTVLAPCILPVLPVILGTTVAQRGKYTPYVVVGALSVSIILFTFLLKATTLFLVVPPEVWASLSGGIIAFFGLLFVYPRIGTYFGRLRKDSQGNETLLARGIHAQSYRGDILVGAALGPVFASCSPTYFLILASILPVSLSMGSAAILAYTLGLALMLLLIVLIGERLIGRLSGFSDASGRLKRTMGVLLIVIGLLIAFGIDKQIEAHLLENSVFDVAEIEYRLLKYLP
jgi:cytochrome c-type biogenesis protein